MTSSTQLELPNCSMFATGNDCRALTVDEVAQRLGCTAKHIINLIEEGTLAAAEIQRRGQGNASGRARYRIPVEAFHAFARAALTASWDSNPCRDLPLQTQLRLLREQCRELRKRGVDLRTLQSCLHG